MGFNCGLGTIRDTFTYDKEFLKKLARHNLHKSSYIIPNLCTSPYSLLLDSQVTCPVDVQQSLPSTHLLIQLLRWLPLGVEVKKGTASVTTSMVTATPEPS